MQRSGAASNTTVVESEPVSSIERVQDVVDAVNLKFGTSVASAGEAQRLLHKKGQHGIAKRIKRESRGRNVAAHPDRLLLADIEACDDPPEEAGVASQPEPKLQVTLAQMCDRIGALEKGLAVALNIENEFAAIKDRLHFLEKPEQLHTDSLECWFANDNQPESAVVSAVTDPPLALTEQQAHGFVSLNTKPATPKQKEHLVQPQCQDPTADGIEPNTELSLPGNDNIESITNIESMCVDIEFNTKQDDQAVDSRPRSPPDRSTKPPTRSRPRSPPDRLT